MIVLKSTKFQHFSGNGHTVFKVLSKNYLDIVHYKKRKWICVEMSMIHLLHHHPCRHLHLQQNLQPAQTCTVARSSWSEGQGCLATIFCSFSFYFFMHCNLRGGFSHEFFPLSSFSSVYLLYLGT
jgi:hypothetical protein